MGKTGRNERGSSSVARKRRLLVAAVLATGVLAACGGGDDSPVAAAPAAGPSAGATPPSSHEDETLVGVAETKGSTTLSWMPPTTNDDGTALKLTGYRLYWGLAEDNLTHSVTVENPGLTRYVVEELEPATWYFVATALSSDGESPPSNVIAMQVL